MSSKVSTLVTVVGIILSVYFFSYQLQSLLSRIGTNIANKIGIFSANREHAIQRYVYLHRSSPIALLYNWINEQLIASGLKRVGITPVGYFLFWCLVSAITSVLMGYFFSMRVIFWLPVFIILMAVFLVTTRVVVAEKMEKREAEIMDALDLIIPDIGSGVKNVISRYIDNFAPSLQQDFKIFLSNIQDRGMSFSDAMYVLSDNLGSIFRDFAQKAIFYENIGEEDMRSIFDDIVETNRQRRELRYINDLEFGVLKTSFIVSCVITASYFVFLMLTDPFSRYFFLTTTAGTILLIIMLLIVFGVLCYITTIKSREI